MAESSIPESADEFYFSALEEGTEIFPISDEKYAEALQLQEALMSSAISSRDRHNLKPPRPDHGKQKQQSSGPKPVCPSLCLICMDVKPSVDFFRVSNNCAHSFCTKCMTKYVADKMRHNISEIKCPDKNCEVVMEPHFCRSIVPKQVFDRWGSVLCAEMVSGSERACCPFEDCSAAMVADGGAAVTMAECPSCHRLFCAQCKVAWHDGTSCEEFQSRNMRKRKREGQEGNGALKKEVKEEIP